MDNRPIYITGPNRSGTSLMYALLASHPNISMVRRTDMWRYFYGRYGDLSKRDNFERCLTAMLEYKRIVRLKPDPERIRREFWEGEPTYGRLFALIHAHHAEMVGKPRWGDKSLHTEHHLDQIFAEFPQAKIILCVRDPRDRFASERGKFKASPGSATRKWMTSIKAFKYGLEQYPEGCLLVPYEILARSPEETLHKVCSFINEDYSPAMLTMKGAPRHVQHGGNSSFESFEPGEISTHSIGRFRQVVSGRDIAFIQLMAGKDMAKFGYQMHPVRLSGYQRLGFYLMTLPVNFARMTRSLIMNTIKNAKGRTIRSHRIVKEATI